MIHLDAILNPWNLLFAANYDRYVIANAMTAFHAKTCIRFVARSSQADYISIENKDG